MFVPEKLFPGSVEGASLVELTQAAGLSLCVCLTAAVFKLCPPDPQSLSEDAFLFV